MLETEMDKIHSPVNSSLGELGRQYKKEGVDLVIAASTHWQNDEFLIDDSKFHKTVYDYYGFRTSLEYDVAGHPEMARWIFQEAEKEYAFPRPGHHGADHAVTIPMHFLFPEKDIPVVITSVGGSLEESLHRGSALRHAVDKSPWNVLFIASGSLSHDLEAFVYRQPDPVHRLFDRTVMDLLEQGKGKALADMDPALVRAGKPEGAFRDVFMLLGFMGPSVRGRVEAFESIPGVGLGVICFENDPVLKS